MKKLFEYLKAGTEMVLVTILASSGAAPRGAGTHMIVTKQGRVWGTIGGGAVEYRSEQMAMQVLKEKKSVGQTFSLTKDDIQNLGMICGGTVQVFFHYVPEKHESYMLLAEKAIEIYEADEDLWLLSDITNGGSLGLYNSKTGLQNADDLSWIVPHLTCKPQITRQNEKEIYSEQILSAGKVYVFGCGHVARELVPVLSHVGFRCVAMDDRKEFACEEYFPTAEKVMLIDFMHISDYVQIRAEDYVCIMTRGHAYDTAVQAQVLRTPADYIGVIGSEAKKAGVYKQLYEMGFSEKDTDRIHSPIGLKIKAETPAEIAVSIAGEMIMHRAGRKQ